MIAAAVILYAIAVAFVALTTVGMIDAISNVSRSTKDEIFTASVTAFILMLVAACLCALASLAWGAAS